MAQLCPLVVRLVSAASFEPHGASTLSLTKQGRLLSFAHSEEGADGMRRGVAQDGIQHRLADLANQILALAVVGLGQNVADLLQQVDDGGLGDMHKAVSHLCKRWVRSLQECVSPRSCL